MKSDITLQSQGLRAKKGELPQEIIAGPILKPCYLITQLNISFI